MCRPVYSTERDGVHAGIDGVVGEDRAALHQSLVRRQGVAVGQLSRTEEAFLVGENKDDVAGPLRRAGRVNALRAALERCCRGGTLRHAQPQADRADAGGGEKIAACKKWT